MSKIILIIFLAGILIFGYYSIVFEPNNIKIERQVIIIENLPQPFDGVRIVQLSDFHSWWFGSREKMVLEMLEELKPDFVFITGDFVDPFTKVITDPNLDSVKIFWQILGEKYENRLFAVLGNHDTKIVKNYLAESGIVILNNENKKLTFNGESSVGDESEDSSSPRPAARDSVNEYIYLVGVDDPRTRRANLSKAMKGINEDRLKILLAHASEIIDEALEKNIDLVLVGDTHGGQVNIPFFGRLIQPLSEYGKKYTQGLFKLNGTYLYVNRGIGTSFFPIRFNSPPEITLIELQKM